MTEIEDECEKNERQCEYSTSMIELSNDLIIERMWVINSIIKSII